MNPQAKELFHELANLSPSARANYYAEFQVPAAVRDEVESLLQYDGADTDLWAAGIIASAAEVLESHSVPPELSRCGQFRLVRLLGNGGMGSVYLAERADGEVEQRVAIKFLRFGMHPPSFRERFLRERQILASLNHPGIARLIDAGHRADGQPYLVMEYIDGTPVDVFAKDVSLRMLLTVFLKILDAVSSAHRNLIIHRDLKPSNILIDAAGEPKLLDFGISKVLDDIDTTQTIERVLTPEYASPEQLRGLPQTTATDIYSLGAVLYRLLAGRSPGAAELTPPSRVKREIPRDLDFIVVKALRQKPEDRYSSAEAFGDDIRAFLDSRPVAARRGNVFYRARKVASRYWPMLVAASIAIAGLAIGLYVANRERAIAVRRFGEVRQLSNKLFEIDRQVRQLPGGSKTRQLIVETSLEYLRRLAVDVSNDPDLALDLGTAYMRVGRVQGVPISANLGQMEEAEKSLHSAEDLIASVIKVQPANRVAILRAAQVAHDRMILAELRRPTTAALPLARKSESWLQKYLDSGPVDQAEAEAVVITGMNIANWYVREDLTSEAVRLLRRTTDIAMATQQPLQAGAATIVLARALRSTGDLEGALATIGDGIRLLTPPPGETKVFATSRFGLALVTKAEILGEDNAVSLGRPQEALRYFQQAFDIAADRVRQDANESDSRQSLYNAGYRLAAILRHSDARKALTICDVLLLRLAEVKNNTRARRDEVRVLSLMASASQQLGRLQQARQRLDAAFARLTELKLYPADEVEPGSEPDNALRALAEYEAATGPVDKGIAVYQRLREQVMASKPEPHANLADATHLSNIDRALAVLLRRAHRHGEAAEADARRLALWRHWDHRLPGNSFVLRQLASLRPQR